MGKSRRCWGMRKDGLESPAVELDRKGKVSFGRVYRRKECNLKGYYM